MKSITRSRAEGGWTLIELMVVISLIMILSSIALASYRTRSRTRREAALRSDLMLMRDAIDQYYADKGAPGVARRTRVGELPADGAEDPFTDSTTSWQTTEADAPPGRSPRPRQHLRSEKRLAVYRARRQPIRGLVGSIGLLGWAIGSLRVRRIASAEALARGRTSVSQ
jgi:general secretion pathway protein G